jgi:hypothetical protein
MAGGGLGPANPAERVAQGRLMINCFWMLAGNDLMQFQRAPKQRQRLGGTTFLEH